MEYVTTTQHGSRRTYPRSQVRFDGTHPKVVYHKDGWSTHFFRLANSGDEPPENHYRDWRYPPLVDWADLDGALLIRNDCFDGVTIVDGRITLPARPGIGVEARANIGTPAP